MTVKVVGLPQFVNHVQKVTHDAKTLDARVVGAVALEAKITLIASAEPKSLSRFGNGRGVKLGASFKVIPANPPTALLLPTPPGPWYLLEHGGKEHQIGKRVRGRGARGRRGQVGFLGSPGRFAATGPVEHPPFRPKHTWQHAASRAVAAGSGSFGRKQRQQYMKLFKG